MGPVSINDAAIADVVGNIRFFSITYRLFKLPGLLEPDCEDYAQLATYKVRFLDALVLQCMLQPLIP